MRAASGRRIDAQSPAMAVLSEDNSNSRSRSHAQPRPAPSNREPRDSSPQELRRMPDAYSTEMASNAIATASAGFLAKRMGALAAVSRCESSYANSRIRSAHPPVPSKTTVGRC